MSLYRFFYLLDENYFLWTENSNNQRKIPQLSMLFNQKKFGI